jgi:hypothetical protein
MLPVQLLKQMQKHQTSEMVLAQHLRLAKRLLRPQRQMPQTQLHKPMLKHLILVTWVDQPQHLRRAKLKLHNLPKMQKMLWLGTRSSLKKMPKCQTLAILA